jgi:hypothetical protein
MAQGRGSATQGLALGLLVVCLFLGADVAGAATYNVDWSFAADSWSGGKSFRAGDVLGEWTDPSVRQCSQLLIRVTSSVLVLSFNLLL